MLVIQIKQKPFKKIPFDSNSYKKILKFSSHLTILYSSSYFQHIISNHMMNGETIRLDGAIRMQP
jgi:hypothetical protein